MSVEKAARRISDDDSRQLRRRLAGADRVGQQDLGDQAVSGRNRAGLAESKEAVEAFAAGGDLSAAGDDLQDRIPVDDPDLAAEVTTLLQEGKALPAIKLVRVRTGVSLKEAKNIVDKIGEDAGLLAQSGS